MKTLYLDCFSGMSGDMFVGAMLDLGFPLDELRAELAKLGMEGEYELHARREGRCEITATKFDVEVKEKHHHHHHHHDHHHGHHHGRGYSEIVEMIRGAGLGESVERRACGIFKRIGEAEAKIHGKSLEEIHFHEVGAVDSIVDVVGACVAVEGLGVEQVLASPLVDGRGWIECAHGKFPIPAPATLEILKGVPITQVEVPYEMITPTGAAILKELAASFAPLSGMEVEKVGYGAGSRELGGRPNVLRALLGERVSEAAEFSEYEQDEVVVVECHLDDCTGEVLGYLTERLMKAGAVDTGVFPLMMKKGRPAYYIQVMAPLEAKGQIVDLIFRETTAFGLRISSRRRLKLRREFREVATPWGTVRVKLGMLGTEAVQSSPEYEDCRALAEKHGVALKEVYRCALEAMK